MAKQSTAKKATQWLAGNRIGKVSASVLRARRVDALIGGTVDVDVFIETIESLEDILHAAEKHDPEERGPLVVEEIPDVIHELEEARADIEDEAKRDVVRLEQTIECLKQDHAAERAESVAHVVDLCKELDELRARTERAEHALGELAATLDVQRARAENAESESRDLLKMLGAIRAEKPLKVRKGKS